MKPLTIYVINGPNLQLLGIREPAIYGTTTLDEINKQLAENFSAVEFHFFQTNNESELVQLIHHANNACNGVVLNAAAFSHTSVAIADAVASIKIPVIAVHISNIYQRENFRQQDIVGEKCKGAIVGLGIKGYQMAVECLLDITNPPN